MAAMYLSCFQLVVVSLCATRLCHRCLTFFAAKMVIIIVIVVSPLVALMKDQVHCRSMSYIDVCARAHVS